MIIINVYIYPPVSKPAPGVLPPARDVESRRFRRAMGGSRVFDMPADYEMDSKSSWTFRVIVHALNFNEISRLPIGNYYTSQRERNALREIDTCFKRKLFPSESHRPDKDRGFIFILARPLFLFTSSRELSSVFCRNLYGSAMRCKRYMSASYATLKSRALRTHICRRDI